MKNFFKLVVCLFTVSTYAQNETIKIKDLEMPNSPAFTILDYSPTIISNPKTTQEFTLSLINSVNTSSGIPTNFALEFTPFWTFSGENTSLKSYLKSEAKKTKTEPYKNLSISLASVKKDSIQNVSIGIRTNIITINNRNDEIKNKIELINKNLIFINKIIDDKYDYALTKNKVESGSKEDKILDKLILNNISNDKAFKELAEEVYKELDEIKNLKSKPQFSVDIASAYNHFFDNNEFKSGKFGRFGAWATVNENFIFKKDSKNYFSMYQYVRYLINEMNYDATTMSYIKDKSLDLGLKAEFQFSDLTIGYEYVLRTSEKDNYRSVGNIKYKINDNIILNGGFGKNFEKTDNLISFLGVSWGISQNNNLKIQNP
jgi:hypothetical protein